MSTANGLTIFAAKAATGNGDPVSWPGGDGLLAVDGTWGGTSFKLQFSFDGGDNFKELDSSVVFTANAVVVITLPPGFIRGVLTGGAAMNINAMLGRVP